MIFFGVDLIRVIDHVAEAWWYDRAARAIWPDAGQLYGMFLDHLLDKKRGLIIVYLLSSRLLVSDSVQLRFMTAPCCCATRAIRVQPFL